MIKEVIGVVARNNCAVSNILKLIILHNNVTIIYITCKVK